MATSDQARSRVRIPVLTKMGSNMRVGDVTKTSGHLPQTEFSQVTLLFADALRLHQAGRLIDAEEAYNRILAMQPDQLIACICAGSIAISAAIMQKQFVKLTSP